MRKVNLQLGTIVREFRQKRNMTQLELAQKLGYDSSQFVSIFERGLSKIPLETIGRLIVILGIPEKEIMKTLIADYQEQLSVQIRAGKKAAV